VTAPSRDLAVPATSSHERPGISVESSNGVDQIRSWRADWDGVFSAAPNEPSSSYEWTDALTHSHFVAGDRVVLVRLRRGLETIALVALVARSEKVAGLPIVTISPISEWYNTHSSLLVRERTREVADAFVNALVTLGVRWDLFRMSRWLEEDPLLQHLRASLTERGQPFECRPIDPSYLLELPGSFEAYLASRSAKFRNHLKRTRRKIDELRTARVVEWNEIGDVDRAYEMLLAVETNSWKQHHGTAITTVGRQMIFYREMAREAASLGRLRLHFLTIEGVPVAYNLGYLAGGCYSYLKTSFDEKVRSLGASTYLRAHLVESLITQGVRWLDFPAEPYEWERQWAETVRWHRSLLIYNSTWPARLVSIVNRIRRRPAQAPQLTHHDPRQPVPAR
jgi:CelD/BcsL family acetyltransferase involved in cellulose biosynthesis